MPCPCNDIVDNLKEQIKIFLKNLNIFDVDNVMVGCLKIEKNQNQEGYNADFDGDLSLLRGKKGIYIVVGNSCKLECDNQSDIIYIGGQEEIGDQTLDGRIEQFKNAFNRTQSNHSGAEKIKKRMMDKKIKKACLYIFGFPLIDRHKCKIEKVEGCFQVIYAYYYDKSPCFVDKMPAADFTIFCTNSQRAKQLILSLLHTIDLTFRDCIPNC